MGGLRRGDARVSDTVITCLPSPETVAATVAGEHGILEGLAAGGTWIDMSTTTCTSSSASPHWPPSRASPRWSHR